MKFRFAALLLLIPCLLFSLACERPPELSSTPQITLNSIVFKENVQTASGQTVDSLIFNIGFEDNEGDLGLTRSDLNPPYQEYIFPKDNSGNLITLGDHDTLPPYNCINWLVNPIVGRDTIRDTVYVKINPDHYNISINYFTKKNGVYAKFDFREKYCIPFDLRFPMLNTRDTERPLQGELIYGYEDILGGFRREFRNDTLMVRIQIKDRALNRSNIVQSQDFTLNSIKVE